MYCVIMEPHASCTCSMQPPSSRHYGCHLPCLSRPTCRFRHSSAAHRRGRGRSRTLRSCYSRNNLPGLCRGQCRRSTRRGSGHCNAHIRLTHHTQSPRTTEATAVAHSGSANGTTRISPHSQRGPQRDPLPPRADMSTVQWWWTGVGHTHLRPLQLSLQHGGVGRLPKSRLR